MRRVLTIIGVVILVIAILLAVGAGVVFAQSNAKINRTYEVPDVADIELPSDEESLAEGARLYVTRGCSDCHLESGEGKVLIDDPALGRIVAPNLTSGAGGVADKYASSGD